MATVAVAQMHESACECVGHEQHMRKAIDLSLQSVQKGTGPFGAVVVKDGVVIGEGHNTVTSHNDPTAHAEVNAIRNACKNLGTFNLQGCVLYTSCEPCPMCLSASYWARVDKMYYGNTRDDAAAIQFDDEFLYREVQLPIAERQLPMEQICHDEALEAFQAWSKKEDKVPY